MAAVRCLQIPTPVGNDSPDWGIVFDTEKYKYIYFVDTYEALIDKILG
jgi:restriction endonuclease